MVPVGTQVSPTVRGLTRAQRAERVQVGPGPHLLLLTDEKGRKEYKFAVKSGEELTVPGLSRRSHIPVATSRTPDLECHRLTGAPAAIDHGSCAPALSDAQSLASRCPDHLCTVSSAADLLVLNEQIRSQQNHAIAARVLIGITAVFAAGTSALILVDWQRQRSGRTLLGPKPASADSRAGVAADLGLRRHAA